MSVLICGMACISTVISFTFILPAFGRLRFGSILAVANLAGRQGPRKFTVGRGRAF